MDTFTAIRERRSVKLYDPEFVMPQQDIDRLLELATLSPTSFNIQNWRFVVIRDKELREQLCAAAWNQAQVREASALIMVCADLNAWGLRTERYWANAPEETRKMLVGMIHQFYKDDKQLQRDEALRSSGMAAQTIMVAAKAMGYDTCPMIGFDMETVSRLIKLPKDHVIGMMIAVGKAVQPARPRGGQLPLDEIVFEDTF
ncbi:nitroreductase family protein [Ruficoccus amylovorans]|uniref:Nitroreductase family protein n=1 Tax=Ruficoccus amylovorans TaxID=1804625 RepID=A0A842HA57_9BACT|nr:nitroreductase family protein [Ruficoccus amylovorans]